MTPDATMNEPVPDTEGTTAMTDPTADRKKAARDLTAKIAATRPVMLATAEQLDQLSAGILELVASWRAELTTAPTTDPGDPGDPGGPTDPLKPLTVKLTAGHGSILTEWTTDPRRPVLGFTVSRDGGEAGQTNGKGWTTSDPATARARTFDKLGPGPYRITVTAHYSDGNEQTITVTGAPLADAPTEPTEPGDPGQPGGRLVPIAGRSHLGYNLTVFQSGANNLPGIDATARLLGLPALDGVLTFPPRQNWDDLRDIDETLGVSAAGGLTIISIPHAPESEGTGMNTRGAANAYAAQQKSLGQYYVSKGLNKPTTILRVNWEWDGDWYAWSSKNGGPDAFKSALRNAVTNYRAGGLTLARIDLCGNKGPAQTGHTFDQVFPGPDIVQIIGVDCYDHWSPARNATQWATECGRTPGLNQAIADAKKHGIMWAIDEGANVHSDTGGGDNPYYYTALAGTVRANAANMSHWNLYNDRGAPNTFHHEFASNPNALTELRKQLTQ
jgi:hypothetical protein